MNELHRAIDRYYDGRIKALHWVCGVQMSIAAVYLAWLVWHIVRISIWHRF